MQPSILDKSNLLDQSSVRVRLAGLGTAVPPLRVSQAETLQFILDNFDISESARVLYRRALGNRAIGFRHFALRSLDEVLESDHDQINRRFQKSATDLSVKALRGALKSSGAPAPEIDFIVTATCTGYLCPGLSSFVAEQMGLRSDVATCDVVGMGCGAALPALQRAHEFLQSHPGKTAAVVCVEICSAAMYSSNDPDIIISNSIFADGAAAVVLTSNADENSDQAGVAEITDFSSLTIPEWRDCLKFTTERGYLKNVLSKEVPERAAEASRTVVASLLEKNDLTFADVDRWLLHAGGEKILTALQSALGISAERTESAWSVLRNFGNMSSPTVLFVLAEELSKRPLQNGETAVMCSFGAGFSAHAALVKC